MTADPIQKSDSPDAEPALHAPGEGGAPTMWRLALGALGVVYGDIGTSPLYTMQTILTHTDAVHTNVAMWRV